MRGWERVLLLIVAGWVGLELLGRVGLLLALGSALAPPAPFRVHPADVRAPGTATTLQIRCPGCTTPSRPGKRPGAPCRVCGDQFLVSAAELGRPVVIVPVDDPSDYR
jgi:hypothetical protein